MTSCRKKFSSSEKTTTHSVVSPSEQKWLTSFTSFIQFAPGFAHSVSPAMNPTTVELISGLSAGFCTTLVTHPLDIIKVRLQLSDSSLSSIVKNLHGSYYRGIMPNLIGNISAWGLYFALYSEFKAIMPAHSTAANYFSSSVLAGLSTSVLTNPIWVLKTRILGTTYAYTSMLDAIKQMLRKEGVASFWKGTIPSMFQVFQASLQITIYDHFTRHDDLSTLYASATSKIISMVVMYPAQVVRARLQNGASSITAVIKQLSREGITPFYRGLGANILRVVPATCVTFVVYERVKRYLVLQD